MNEAIDLLQTLLTQAADLADELTDEEMQEVLRIFQDAIEIIQQQGEVPETTPIENLPSAEYPSSQINGFAYDPQTKKLRVQFHGPYPNAAGPQYEYSEVPEWVFQIFSRGAVGPRTSGANQYHRWEKNKLPSYGAAMNALIKAAGFSFRKLS